MGLKSLVIEVCYTLYATNLIKREEFLAKEVIDFEEVLKVYWKYFFTTAREVLVLSSLSTVIMRKNDVFLIYSHHEKKS